MKETKRDAEGVLTQLSVEECLRGIGTELLMMAEDLIYATKSLDEEGLGELGSDIYLLASVLGCVLRENEAKLRKLGVQLPSNVGAVRIRNPYYDQRSESPKDEASGQSDDSVGEFPF